MYAITNIDMLLYVSHNFLLRLRELCINTYIHIYIYNYINAQYMYMQYEYNMICNNVNIYI